MIQRKPNPNFTPGEMARRCQAVTRDSGRPVYVPEIIAALMKAKRLDESDWALRRGIGRQVRNARLYMERRKSIVKAGTHRAARWGLAAQCASSPEWRADV